MIMMITTIPYTGARGHIDRNRFVLMIYYYRTVHRETTQTHARENDELAYLCTIIYRSLAMESGRGTT